MKENWYDKFNRKSEVADSKNKRKEFNKERDKFFEAKRKKTLEKHQDPSFSQKKVSCKIDGIITETEHLFSASSLPKDSIEILNNFDSVIQNVRPLNSRQILKLPKDIRALSHQLTDERSVRRVGYMNAAEELSAYVRYFSWWNLVRFTRIFSNLPENAFSLKDGDACIDIGSGPLTVVTALWLSRPELRNKKLTFYCMDLSQSALSLGENIYLSVAAKTPPKDKNADAHWNIIKVKGGAGTFIKRKAAFISCANMFNEIRENSESRPDEMAQAQVKTLLSYTDENTSFFIAEPGMPVAAHFVSLMRGKLLENNFHIISPCPHEKDCAMSGLHARFGGSAKWCNLSFTTEDAPQKLLKLSKDAGIPKERAVVTFIFAKRENFVKKEIVRDENSISKSPDGKTILPVRIASDPIWLPENRQGFYACSRHGLVVVVNMTHKKLISGDKIKVSMLKSIDTLPKDKKSGAVEINV